MERHQTLRATVDWSYSLLDDAERLVFERLSVFVGGFDAPAAIAVASIPEAGLGEAINDRLRRAAGYVG